MVIYKQVTKVPLSTDFVAYEYVVKTGDVQTSLTLQGTTQFSNSQKLTFSNKGKVTAVNVKVGDPVFKGQILAAISTDDLDDQVKQARLNLDDANQALKDLLDQRNLDLEFLAQEADLDQLLSKQKTIDQDHALALAQLTQQIEKDKQNIVNAQKSYDDVKADYDELLSGSFSANVDLALSSKMRERNNKFQTAVFDLKTSVNAVRSLLDSYDELMEMSSAYKRTNEDIIYIGAKNTTLIDQSKKLFWEIFAQRDELETIQKTLDAKDVKDLTDTEVLNAYAKLKNLGSNFMIRWEINYSMFKESITTITLTQSVVNKYADSFWTQVQSAWIKYIQQYSTTVNIFADLKDDNSLTDKERELNAAQLVLDQAKTTLEKDQLSINPLLLTQQKEKVQLLDDIDTKKRNIKKIKAGDSLDETKIRQAKNAVTQRQDALRSLMDKYEDYLLEANFDGVITQMDIQMGDNIELGSTNTNDIKYIYVESNNILEMALDVEQVDIIKLKTWMPVVVYLDAYPRKTYEWVVSEINSVPVGQGIATYQVIVAFEKTSPEEIVFAGMGGSAKIVTSQTKNVLVVPNQAITRVDGKDVVSLFENGKWTDREVEIWTSDEQNTQIIAWLSFGDKIRGMYISEEGMINAGLSPEGTPLDMEAMMEQRGQQDMNRMVERTNGNARTSTQGNVRTMQVSM